MKKDDLKEHILIGPGPNGYLHEPTYISAEDWDISEAKLYEIRSWGTYTVLDSGDRYKVKKITINVGEAISLQYHLHRAEHWIFTQGAAEVDIEGSKRTMYPNESIYIKAGERHKCTNIGAIPLEFIEVQTGEYLEEDDIVRIEKDKKVDGTDGWKTFDHKLTRNLSSTSTK